MKNDVVHEWLIVGEGGQFRPADPWEEERLAYEQLWRTFWRFWLCPR